MSLDNQDKQWISEQFNGQFEQLERIRLTERQWVIEQLERLRQYVDQRSEQIETKLLTEFHKWASATEARQRTHAAAIALDLEMEGLDDRLKKLEGPQ